MNPNFQLFVYGSLRQGFGHPAFQYISHYFHFVSNGKVRGRVYDLGEYPAAVPVSGDHYIVGELYAINEPDEFNYAIAQLDDYEGVNPGEGEPSLYRRELCLVDTDKGVSEAWVYWFNGQVENKPYIASGDVLAYMKDRR